jgi:hypothetical protein
MGELWLRVYDSTAAGWASSLVPINPALRVTTNKITRYYISLPAVKLLGCPYGKSGCPVKRVF